MQPQEFPSLELTFRPNVALVTVVRAFVTEFYERVVTDKDVAFRVALTTHELLENAVKYSADGETQIRIGGTLHLGESMIEVRISNNASPAHIVALTRLLDELAAAEDPLLVYQRVMRRNAKRVDGSGLGLARIHAEGEMSLDYLIEGEHVSVVARTRAQGESKS